MKFVISNRRPIPRNSRGKYARNKPSTSRYPWTSMAVGDSFFVKGYVTKKAKAIPRFANKKQMALVTGYKMVPESSWTSVMRYEHGNWGVRVWRTA